MWRYLFKLMPLRHQCLGALRYSLLLLACLWINTLQMAQAALSWADMQQASRYILLPQATNKLLVYDQVSKQSTQIPLAVTPEIASLHAELGQLIYSQSGNKKLFIKNLTDDSEMMMSLPVGLHAFRENPDLTRIAISGEGSTWVLNLNKHQQLQHVEKVADIEADSLLWARDGTLFMSTHQPARLYSFSGDGLKIHLEKQGAMSPLALMPNQIALFFVYEDKLFRLSLLDGEMQSLTTPPLQLFRPYISANSRHVLLLASTDSGGNKAVLSTDSGEKVLLMNAYTYQVSEAFTLPANVQLNSRNPIMTGWQEKRVIFAGSELYFADIAANMNPMLESLSRYQVLDAVVHADSKTLLTIEQHQGKSTLWRTHLGHGLRDKLLDLTEQSSQLFIADSNMLCH